MMLDTHTHDNIPSRAARGWRGISNAFCSINIISGFVEQSFKVSKFQDISLTFFLCCSFSPLFFLCSMDMEATEDMEDTTAEAATINKSTNHHTPEWMESQ
mmetsp:Transcript_15244/g.25084  ORF Transcript_15244/g.25084 Transcript_15244/m.25084 type:complete len:101 (+) Transcript_15244:924-1226(+)